MFIYASVAYIAPLMGLRISKSHRHIRGPRCVFLYSETLRETDKVEMFGIAPPPAYTGPNLYITRAITCRYKSHRQIKFWRDSLGGINSGIQPGETAVTRTCVRSLSLSLSFFIPPSTLFLHRTRDARLFIVLYTRRASFAAITRAHRPRLSRPRVDADFFLR